MPQTILQDFASSIAPFSLWDANGSATGGVFSFSLGTAQEYSGANANGPYDFVQKWYGTKLVNAGAASATLSVYPAYFSAGTNHGFYISVTNGTFAAWSVVNNTTWTQIGSTFTYTPATHVYFSVGINASGNLSARWSTNGVSWTEFATTANVWGTTSAKFSLQAARTAAGGTATTVQFDDFSMWTEPAGSATLALTAAITESATAAMSASANLALTAPLTAAGYKTGVNGPTRWVRVNGTWVKAAQATPDAGSITQAMLAPGLVMTGEIRLWSSNIAPFGWLLTGPSAVSRTTYAALFAAIGTTFGAGDGSTTFNIPNPTPPSGLYYIIKA